MNSDLVARVREFIEMEGRSCLMDPTLITPEYVYRMWGGKVELDEIEEAMKALQFPVAGYANRKSVNSY